MGKKKYEVQEDGSVKVTLLEPIRFGEEVHEMIHLKKPKAKHLRDLNLENVTLDQLLKLASKLSGLEAPIIDEMGIKDTFTVVEAVGDFLPDMAETTSQS